MRFQFHVVFKDSRQKVDAKRSIRIGVAGLKRYFHGRYLIYNTKGTYFTFRWDVRA
jgi:hypothetical protein